MRKVWTARVGSAGNWRIVGEPDEMGPGKKREPSIATKKNGECGKAMRRCQPIFPADGNSPTLPNVFDVAGNPVIGDVTQGVERPVVMPAGIAVAVKRFSNYRSCHVRITVHGKVCARGVKRGHKIARRIDVDMLGRPIGRANAVELQVPGVTSLVDKITRFNIDVAVNEKLHMHSRFHINLASKVTCQMDGHVSLRRSILVNSKLFGEAGEQVDGRCSGGASGRRSDYSIGVYIGRRGLRRR